MRTNDRVIRMSSWLEPRLWLAFGALTIAAASAAVRPAAAQEAPQEAVVLSSAEKLQELVGPIALYPDDLVAIVLPASTYPLQVVQAARFLEDRKRDSSLKPDDDWDDSIVALLNYPEVLERMNDDLDWTYDLGTAVLNQRADVLNAIQDFRDEAYAAGNLRSDERQTVAREDDTIAIKPADPKVIYVPYYEPREVVVYQPVPVYHYYPRPYPVYYYPYPAHYVFDTGFFWGVRSWFSIGWHTHHVHVYDWHYHGHPYFGFNYYDPFYVRNVYIVNVNRGRHDHHHVWEPRHRYGGRPVVRGSEGRVYSADRGVPRRGVLDSNAAAARSREGSVYRSAPNASAGTTTRPSAGTPQPRRGVPSTGYRNRSIESTQQATNAAQAARPAPVERGNAPARAGQPGSYRSGGGMSQALERNRAAAPAVSPRALERSSGMPREATRTPDTRSAPAPVARAPVARAPAQSAGPQRSQSSGGSYRGGAGSQRGAHPAARGNSRSVGR